MCVSKIFIWYVVTEMCDLIRNFVVVNGEYLMNWCPIYQVDLFNTNVI